MAYTNVWSDASPLGSASANTIATIFRSLKTDLQQRVGDLFALPLTTGIVSSGTFATDPLRAYGVRLTDAQDAIIYLGDNSGSPRSLIFKDKTGTNTFFTIGAILEIPSGIEFLTHDIITSHAGGTALAFQATPNGTYDSAALMEWYRDNGTDRAAIGFDLPNSQNFIIETEEAGDIITMRSGAGIACLTLDSNQKIIVNSAMSGYAAYLNSGDGTALEPTWGLSSAALIRGINSSLTVPVGNSVYVHAHLLTKVTAANSASVQGLETWTWASHTSGTVGSLFGLIGNLAVSGVGGTVTNTFALTGGVIVSGGTVTNSYGINTGPGTVDGSSSFIGTGYGVRINPATLSNSGTITNQYGLYIGDITGASGLNIAIFLAGSNDSIFNGSGVALATNTTKGFMFIPSMAGIPSGTPANAGTGRVAMVYDTSNNKLMIYTGSWKGVVLS